MKFCLEALVHNPAPTISTEESVKLSLRNVSEQANFIDRQCGSHFLHDCLKAYILQPGSFNVSVLPYYIINPCTSASAHDQSQVHVFNGKVDESQKLSSRRWQPVNENMIQSEHFSKSFTQDTQPQITTEDLIKTKVAIIAWQFPNRANTFVMNEVMEMHKRGVDITIYSMSQATAECNIVYKQELEQIKNKIICVPQNQLINYKKIQEDRIAFFQNEFRLNLNLCKTIDPTLENYNQQEQECVQNSYGFLEKFIEDIKSEAFKKYMLRLPMVMQK